MPSPDPKDPDHDAPAAESDSEGVSDLGEDDSLNPRAGLSVDDSLPLPSDETPPSIFDSSFGHLSASATLDEPETAAAGTAGVQSEVLRAHAGEETEGRSLNDPHASSAKQSSLLGRAADRRFRPQLRPPTPVLEVMDDDLQGGEKIRLRRRTFTMGRVQGDLILPNDRVMSRRHAEIFLENNKARETTRWMLRDLASVNGTFVRVSEMVLADRERLWLGGNLIRVSIDKPSGGLTLVELKTENADKAVLKPGVHWIGLGPGCVEFLHASPFLDDRGFCIESDQTGSWRLTDRASVNGLWRAIDGEPVELVDGSEFKLGEQHFTFRLP